MAEPISLLGVATSLILPWVLGSVWVFCLLRQSGRWNAFIVAGHGYLVGVFLTTLVIRLWHIADLPLHFWSMAATITGITLVGVGAIRLQTAATRVAMPSSPLETWQKAITAFFLLLIALRYLTIAQELYLRPLFPWDAWMNWAPKAVVWFHYNDLVPYVSKSDWLNATSEVLNYTAGASKAWMYPITIPLVQLWGMLGIGVSDHTLIYLPWLCVAIALGLALYGHLRQAGVSIPIATLGCYVLLNLPYVSVHVALAGYADIWVASCFGCAVFALHEWGENRQWPYALLALVLALMCTQLKIPGLVMGGVVLVVLLTSTIQLGKKSGITLSLGLAAVFLCIATVGIDFSIPNIGQIALSTDGITLPYIGHYELSYHPVHHAMINTTLLMINWNLLWYLFIFLFLLKVANGTLFTSPSLALRSILLALVFIFFVYYFTNRYIFALDYTQVNRALIYVIPPLVFYMMYAYFRPLDLRHRSRPS